MIDRRLVINFNWTIFILMLLIIAIGVVNLYSSTYVIKPSQSDTCMFFCNPVFTRQILWIVIGFGAFILATLFDYHKLQYFAPAIYFFGLVLLGAVLVVGEESHGAVRWLRIGSFQFQPSEFEKLILVISIAAWGASDSVKLYPPFKELFIFIILNALPCLLVFIEPDLGTAILLAVNSLTMLFCLGIRKKLIIILAIFGLVTAFPLWQYGLKDYQKDRIRVALDPDRDPKKRGYHTRQAGIAIGSGQLEGKGYLQGTQSKLRFLPERHTDFAFAVWAEEWGFIGASTLILLFAIFIYFCFQASFSAKDRFGSLLIIGLASNIAWETVINIGMVIGFLPVVGVPLPFISYGGSSMLKTMIAVGLIQNVCMRKHAFKN